ncbi:MAG: hypothetical protein COT91_04150 [Candidatus Doudnabacteria bacterium CG10_big_fil_rev_8_21_14_0_10_41_10]|uniref:Uncharacterized protein n=1 Tax=Candidatus Doudnabacteria bacterium CG10_big_fil_rev_8_21_14_0_10_41_10 TaxID=1974551 RepID=A0A2H0VCW7_9BACT|nr:MAG: hypothetical protein COT91_04150 [Candidatus Doudnabacteria bacterium CG10_big_fil_rev_8_21_14_0_10_41_10]
MNWRRKVKLVVFVIVVLAGSYFYYWYNETVKLRAEAKTAVENAKKYSEVDELIKQEVARCQGFISQSEGEFGSFEYCKKYIEWADSNSLSN